MTLFRTTTWSSYTQALKRRGALMVWFGPEMSCFAAPDRQPDHPERFSAVAIQFCLWIKVPFGLPLRQETGFVERLVQLLVARVTVGETGLAVDLRHKGLRAIAALVAPPKKQVA